MILIRFPNTESKRRALGGLAGRFAFKSWAVEGVPAISIRGARTLVTKRSQWDSG